jgi:hypothetical protein
MYREGSRRKNVKWSKTSRCKETWGFWRSITTTILEICCATIQAIEHGSNCTNVFIPIITSSHFLTAAISEWLQGTNQLVAVSRNILVWKWNAGGRRYRIFLYLVFCEILVCSKCNALSRFHLVQRQSLGMGIATVPLGWRLRQQFSFISGFTLQIFMSINVREIDKDFYA